MLLKFTKGWGNVYHIGLILERRCVRVARLRGNEKHEALYIWAWYTSPATGTYVDGQVAESPRAGRKNNTSNHFIIYPETDFCLLKGGGVGRG